ncbi:MAG TPA: 5-histidylcysteine sulfoxide synthase, partial [Bacteroidetes bacterium]|nr:5-histidylcysteine sulfoxide synthase [Bacteroidota bacterium]
TWELYEWLFSSIHSDEALYVNPDPRRHPLIFYLGHTAVFYVNKLMATGVITERINPEFEHLFAVGVDPATVKELDISAAWPSVDAVRAYRQKVFTLVLTVIDKADFSGKIDWDHPLWALFMGLEHDRIHFETSSALIRQYPLDVVKRPAHWQYSNSNGLPPANEIVSVAGGVVTIGHPKDSNMYGWDNEYGQQQFEVADFEVSQNMVSNAEYLEFVAADGYNMEALWSEAGWAWRVKYGMDHPKFWVANDEGFQYRAMFDLLPMPMDWPAEVTCFEVEAYCSWKGSAWRLLSEREWKLLSDRVPSHSPHNYNLNIVMQSPSPVGQFANKGANTLVNDLYGNVWDWLSDDFYKLSGYQVHPIYLDFSEPYIDENHGMMAGGSWASSGTSASQYYRLWFRRGFFQHAGFRLAKSI